MYIIIIVIPGLSSSQNNTHTEKTQNIHSLLLKLVSEVEWLSPVRAHLLLISWYKRHLGRYYQTCHCCLDICCPSPLFRGIRLLRMGVLHGKNLQQTCLSKSLVTQCQHITRVDKDSYGYYKARTSSNITEFWLSNIQVCYITFFFLSQHFESIVLILTRFRQKPKSEH